MSECVRACVRESVRACVRVCVIPFFVSEIQCRQMPLRVLDYTVSTTEERSVAAASIQFKLGRAADQKQYHMDINRIISISKTKQERESSMQESYSRSDD